MARREWAEELVASAQRRYPNANTLNIAALVAVKEHARAVRIVKRLQKNAERGGFGLAYGVALKDVLTALQKGRA